MNGRVILYADNITRSMKKAIDETNRRREIQLAHNKKHGITPKTISKKIADITDHIRSEYHRVAAQALKMELMYKKPRQLIKEKHKAMSEAVKILDFETAAIVRDEIAELEKLLQKR